MLRKPARATMLALVMTLAVAQVAVAHGATADPIYKVPGDSAGNTLPLTVRANGFTPGQQVNVEQCDGVAPTAIGFDVTDDCDNGASPAPVIADAFGVATFTAGGTHSFTPFKGESPSTLFNCLSPNEAPISNGLTNYRNCKVRVSSNNATATSDQKFLNIELPDVAGTFDPKFNSGEQVAATTSAAGSCEGGISLAKVKTAVLNAGLSDQTQDVSIASALLKDTSVTPATVIGGTCSGLVNSKYAGTNTAFGVPTPLGTLHESAVVLKLTGATSCAFNPASVGADATNADAYELTGSLTITFAETYLNARSVATHYMSTVGIVLKRDASWSDVWDVSGQVEKGLSVGANVSGTVYLDPVAAFGGSPTNITSNVGFIPPLKSAGYTGYGLDAGLTSAWAGCSDAVANNSNSPAVTQTAVVRHDTGSWSPSSSSVTDGAITFADQGDPVSGSGIPANSFVGTVSSGSFLLSKSPTSQVNVLPTLTEASKPLNVTTTPAKNIKAQTGIPSLQLGDGTSLLGSPTTGISFSF